MADLDLVLRALPRIFLACRTRLVRDPVGGREVSAHQAVILSHLDEVDPTMVGELADHLGVTASTMSLTLKRLEEGGFVRRDRDPEDRRVMNVRLTERGARVRGATRELSAERVDGMLRLLSPADRRDALRGLSLLSDAADRLVRRGRESLKAQVEGERP